MTATPTTKKFLTFATPQRGSTVREDLMLVLDVSPSMEDDDYHPSRLRAAIEASCGLIDEKCRHGPADRVGVVSFSGDANVIHPLVDIAADAHVIKRAICGMSTGSCTSITAGLEQAGEMLGERKPPSKGPWGALAGLLSTAVYDDATTAKSAGQQLRRVIVLSDGEHNTGPKRELFATADRLKASGIVVATIGIGGSPEAVEEDDLKRISSPDPETKKPMYCFIADSAGLLREFKKQANYLRLLKDS